VTQRAITFSILRYEEVTKILDSVDAGGQPSLLVYQQEAGDFSFKVSSEYLTERKLGA